MLELITTNWGHKHYWKHVICRVPNFGHSAKTCFAERRTRQNMTLGKDLHSAKAVFAECLALGKGRHLAKIGRGLTASSGILFAECPPFGTQQRIYFAECQNLALGKIFFFWFFATNFFWSFSTLPQTTCLNLGHFHCLLAYFYSLFCFVEFFQKI